MRLGQAGTHGLEIRLELGAEIPRRVTLATSLAVLATGFVVLIGAAAAGERARVFKASVLRTLGATRGQVLASFALRSALTGAAAGLFAVLVAGLAAWAILTQVMELDYRFAAGSAILIVTGGNGPRWRRGWSSRCGRCPPAPPACCAHGNSVVCWRDACRDGMPETCCAFPALRAFAAHASPAAIRRRR